jgi:two-component system, OmpR family, response regulator
VPPEPRGGTIPDGDSRKMKVLVVEDEPDVLSGLAQALREEGYAVDTASDGATGLEAAERGDYDALVLDILIPKLDGWELLRRLRRRKNTPVLMLTARDKVADRIRGLDTGADDYLVKPFDLPELLARVRALIRRSTGRPGPRQLFGEVTLDTASRTVRRGREPVALTALEYALVELLASRRGQWVTRGALYERLFDGDDPSLSNLLEVHVSNIRKKLGPRFIVTRRGYGYAIA